jgi:lysophosphatidic acid acyltransferase / lysophosphatidylinositol acyltransferase
MTFIILKFSSVASFTVDYWSQSKIILYTKDGNIEKIQNSYNFLLANHSSGIDHFVPVAWADKIRILGSSNAFMKKSIMYFPIIGQCFLFCCRFIFLDRSFEKDEKNIKNQLENFIKLKSKAASSILYPEGTRFTKEKLKDSIEFAKSRNLPTLQYHLIPRTKGFKTCVEVMKNMKEKCAVINYQTYFKGPEPTIMNLFKGKSMEFHIFIDYIPIENVEATDKWLIDLFKTKDELHESFEKFGNFHKGRNLATIKGVEMKPRKRVLINFLFWLVVTVISCIKFSSSMIQSGYFMILIAVILTCK